MSYKTYRMWKTVIVIIIAVSVSSSVVAGLAFVPVPVAAVGAAVMLLLRRRVKEVIIDERTYRIAERAGRLAFQVGAIATALIAATLLALGRDADTAFDTVGITLAFAAAGLLAIYYAGYLWYARKLGGED
jgi:uncharacterized membrane protein